MFSAEIYLKPLEKAFANAADAEYAVSMKRYMKDNFEYMGLKSPIRREIQSKFLKERAKPDAEDLPATVKYLWSKLFREYQYFAMDLAGKYARKAPEDFIELYEFLCENKQWWDSIDFIAKSLVGVHFLSYPHLKEKYLKKWTDSSDMWLVRTAILHQLGYKKDTDKAYLFEVCRRFAPSKEFFIRKSIGWALREYSKTDPESVEKFVAEEDLSNLSRREAMKVIERNRNKTK